MWILIVFGLYYDRGGIAIDSIPFESETLCLAAKEKIENFPLKDSLDRPWRQLNRTYAEVRIEGLCLKMEEEQPL